MGTFGVDGLPSFDVVAAAALTTWPQVAAVVGEDRCTVFVAPDAMSPKWQMRTPAVIEHWAAPVPPSIVQLRPAFVGSVSVTVTSFAVPAPPFVTVIV